MHPFMHTTSTSLAMHTSPSIHLLLLFISQFPSHGPFSLQAQTYYSICLFFPISSVESQKGAITIQICSIKNQKGAITIQRCSIKTQKGAITIQRCSLRPEGRYHRGFCTPIAPFCMVLNGTSLNIDSALLALN